MYNRAAIMEALMAAFIVASWYCSTRAERIAAMGRARGRHGDAGVFHQGGGGVLRRRARAGGVDARIAGGTCAEVVPPEGGSYEQRLSQRRWRRCGRSAGWRSSFGVIAALFVLPHWRDYQFYNWQMSVTRKPSYDLASVLRAA